MQVTSCNCRPQNIVYQYACIIPRVPVKDFQLCVQAWGAHTVDRMKNCASYFKFAEINIKTWSMQETIFGSCWIAFLFVQWELAGECHKKPGLRLRWGSTPLKHWKLVTFTGMWIACVCYMYTFTPCAAPSFCMQISFNGVERATRMEKTTPLKFLWPRVPHFRWAAHANGTSQCYFQTSLLLAAIPIWWFYFNNCTSATCCRRMTKH